MTSFKVAALGFMDMLTRVFDTAVPLYFLLSLKIKKDIVHLCPSRSSRSPVGLVLRFLNVLLGNSKTDD